VSSAARLWTERAEERTRDGRTARRAARPAPGAPQYAPPSAVPVCRGNRLWGSVARRSRALEVVFPTQGTDGLYTERMRKTTITIRLPVEDRADVLAIAERRSQTVSEVVRDAILREIALDVDDQGHELHMAALKARESTERFADERQRARARSRHLARRPKRRPKQRRN
jgi:predicted DNA-binding protein